MLAVLGPEVGAGPSCRAIVKPDTGAGQTSVRFAGRSWSALRAEISRKCEPRHAQQRNSLLPPSSWSSRGPGDRRVLQHRAEQAPGRPGLITAETLAEAHRQRGVTPVVVDASAGVSNWSLTPSGDGHCAVCYPQTLSRESNDQNLWMALGDVT